MGPKRYSPAEVYLCFYNLMLAMGWGIILVQLASHLLFEQTVEGLWEQTRPTLLLFQTCAVLEVVHCCSGLVRSSALLTLCQVFSRLFIVWPVLYALPQTRTSLGFPMLLAAWCPTEVIRYLFYFLGLIDRPSQTLIYLRYTLFLGLYPLGVAGEVLCVLAGLAALPLHPLNLALPNPLNLAFDMWTFTVLVLASYPPVFYQLYTHMLRQRNKILGAPRPKAE